MSDLSFIGGREEDEMLISRPGVVGEGSASLPNVVTDPLFRPQTKPKH